MFMNRASVCRSRYLVALSSAGIDGQNGRQYSRYLIVALTRSRVAASRGSARIIPLPQRPRPAFHRPLEPRHNPADGQLLGSRLRNVIAPLVVDTAAVQRAAD